MNRKKGLYQKKWREKPLNREGERIRTKLRWKYDPKVKVRRRDQLREKNGLIKKGPCVFCGKTKKETIIERHQWNYDINDLNNFFYVCLECHLFIHIIFAQKFKQKNNKGSK